MTSAIFLIVVVLLNAAVIWLGTRLVSQPWWPALLFQQPYRPRLLLTSLLVVAAGLALLCSLSLRSDAALAAFVIVFFLFGPMLVCRLSAWRAWRQDLPDLRLRAAAVRNRRNEQLDLAEQVSASRFWLSYIIDAERARRQAGYRPPG